MADLHSCLQETYGTRVLQLVCHVLLITDCLTLQDGQVRGNGLIPPGNPAQLPKEKQKNCHQGQSTHNNYHREEADGELYRGREGNSDRERGGMGKKKRKEKKDGEKAVSKAKNCSKATYIMPNGELLAGLQVRVKSKCASQDHCLPQTHLGRKGHLLMTRVRNFYTVMLSLAIKYHPGFLLWHWQMTEPQSEQNCRTE